MSRTVLVVSCCLCVVMAACVTAQAEGKIKTLLATGGEIHDSKGCGDVVQKALEATGKFEITRVHEDLDAFVAPKLDPYDLIIFHWTVGTISDAQKHGLLKAVASGKGFVGWHSTADSFRGDPEYAALVGGHFITHPRYRRFQVSVGDTEHFITKGMDEFFVTDEQYILDYDPRVHVLCSGLWQGKAMPVAWTKQWSEGRVFYLSLGHDPKACDQKVFKTLITRAAIWAAKQEKNEE